MSREEATTAAGAVRRYAGPVLFLLLGLTAAAALLYVTYGNVKGEMIEALNERQRVHARQAARGIETYFQNQLQTLQQLAKNEHIVALDRTGKGLLHGYYRSHREAIVILSRIDREGRIVHAEPFQADVVGQPVSLPERFAEVRRTGRPVVTDVFTNRRGRQSVQIHVPVQREGRFDGTLSMLLPFDLIARRYAQEIRIGQGGYAWVISRDGTELFCPVPGHEGHSVLENCRDFPDILAMARRMMAGEEGTAAYRFDRVRGETVRHTTKHAVFLPIRLDGTFWSIVVATPEDEVLMALDSFRNRLLLIALLLAAVMGCALYVLFRNRALAAEVARRRRTEAALQAKTAELDQYFSSSLDLLCIADTEGRFRRLNPEWERTLGYPLAELEGQPFLDHVHPEDREATRRATAALAGGEEVFNFVNRYRHRNGTYRWIEWRSYADGQTIYAAARDITERRQAQEEQTVLAEIGRVIGSTLALEEVYERFAAEVRKLIPFDRLVVNLNHPGAGEREIAYVSGVEIPGKGQGERLSLPGSINETLMRTRTGVIYQVRTLAEAVAICADLGPTFETGHRSLMSVPLIARGEVIGALHFRAKTENLYGERDLRLAQRVGDQIAGAMANARLFGDLVQTERALRQSRERLQAAQKVARLGHWDWHLREERLAWSEEMAHLLGVEAPGLSGGIPEAIARIVHPDDRDAVGAHARRAAEGGEVPPLAFRIVRPDGGVRHLWLEFGERTRGADGRPETLSGIVLDVTERHRLETERLRLEERLRRAEKMEALGLLAGGVAHDLNNVLGVLVGYSELLQAEIGEGHRLHRHVQNILASGLKGAAIIQDLLTLARRGVAVAETVNLNGVLTEYLASPEFQALKGRNPGVTFRVEPGAGLLNIKGSPLHLGKTVMNLVSNAVDAIAGVGEVAVRTANRYLDRPVPGYDEVREGDFVVLSVSDTGGGIPAEDLGKIFEPFYTKKVMGRSGTGLGLAVVWGAVKDHGGYIDVQSREGEGSVFTLYFPVTREALPGAEASVSAASYQGRGEQLLVVDDVAEQRDLATSMLERLGYRVSAVASGEAALAWLREREAALVILDMIMDPGLDGLETYRQMLGVRPGQRAVIVSGFSETERVRQAQALGAGPYVRKPYVLETIGLAVRGELDRPATPP